MKMDIFMRRPEYKLPHMLSQTCDQKPDVVAEIWTGMRVEAISRMMKSGGWYKPNA
jgi:hypothetical protein